MSRLAIAGVLSGHGRARTEFIAIIAVMTALTALSIDIMLPALPAMSDFFGLAAENDRQLVITVYILGFSAGQLVWGPVSDSFGRRPMVLVGLGVYALATLGTFLASDFTLFLAARALQGIGAAAPRVIATAIVRDLFGGRKMAQVMSFVTMIFIIIPILAPSIGELLLFLGEWHWIFVVLLAMATLVTLLTLTRLPETRLPAMREKLSLHWVAGAMREVVTTRVTFGYTAAIGLLFGCMMSYINSAQQVFEGIYELDAAFAIVFGAIACTLAAAALINGVLVQRIGMRRLSHTALIGFVIVAGFHAGLVAILDGPPPLVVFAGLLSLDLFFFGLAMPNFNAIAMEPLFRIAGTASSFMGFFTTLTGAVFGWIVGQSFDGSVGPLTLGYFVFSAAALLVVFWTERGRLFHAGHEAHAHSGAAGAGH